MHIDQRRKKKKKKKTCLKSEWNDTSSRFEKLEGRALSLNPSKQRIKSGNSARQRKKIIIKKKHIRNGCHNRGTW